ncbi:MAG: hypothetical protein QG622_116 [Actinomycetota bacterium]|nr:hypothetical protein [Actinomycetota bacterium]
MDRAVTTAAFRQAALAEFGRFALQSPDITGTVGQALDVAGELLKASAGLVIKRLHGPADFLVLATRGEIGLTPGARYDVPPEFEQLHVDGDPLVVEDWLTRTRPRLLPYVDPLGMRALLSVPLLVEGRPWGRLVVVFDEPRTIPDPDVDLVRSVAHMLSAALARDRVEKAHATMSAFGEFALATRDITATFEKVLDVMIEIMDAPMGAVLRLGDEPGLFEVLAGRGPIASLTGLQYQAPPRGTPMPRGDQPFVISDWHAHPQASQVSSLLRLGVAASVSAPLTVGGRTWGRLIAYFARPRQSDATDVDLLQSMAHLLSSALERNASEKRLRETAEAFQRALLPSTIPDVPGIEATFRYLPAHGGQVGGDWFDLLVLPGGSAGLVMGDVEGHDSSAAAIMGQIRTILRTHASEGHSPGEVLGRANQFVIGHTDHLVTCCYLELNADELTLTGASAGHPLPLLVTPDGEVRPLSLAAGPLMGLDEGIRYSERTAMLPPRATLLLFTDGLADDSPLAVHPDAEAFSALASAAVGLPIEQYADLLVTPPDTPGAQQDDAALLIVRLTGPVRPRVPGLREQARRMLHPSPESALAARRFVGDVLASWDLDHLQDSAALAVSELVTNSLIHTTSSIWLTLRLRAEHLWIGVFDDSDRLLRHLPVSPDDVSGRGLAIVESLADSWGVEAATHGSGKTVWLELALGTPGPPGRDAPAG